jgi:hypothetical protein
MNNDISFDYFKKYSTDINYKGFDKFCEREIKKAIKSGICECYISDINEIKSKLSYFVAQKVTSLHPVFKTVSLENLNLLSARIATEVDFYYAKHNQNLCSCNRIAFLKHSFCMVRPFIEVPLVFMLAPAFFILLGGAMYKIGAWACKIIGIF